MNPPRILVTGASGFIGRHLVKLLAQRPGIEIVTTSSNLNKGHAHVCNLSSFEETERLLKAVRPVCIFHCAGTFTNSWETDFASNVGFTKNLLDGMVKHSIPCRLLAIGSAAEYGRQACPPSGIRENAQLLPVSVYGLTKMLQTHLLAYYHRVHGLNVVLARTFNLYGAGCNPSLFPGRIEEQIQAIKSGRQTHIIVGRLEALRDYLPISEAVKFYFRIMEKGVAGGVYNVGSGTSTRMSDFLNRLLAENGFSPACVRLDPSTNSASVGVEEMFADITMLESLGA